MCATRLARRGRFAADRPVAPLPQGWLPGGLAPENGGEIHVLAGLAPEAHVAAGARPHLQLVALDRQGDGHKRPVAERALRRHADVIGAAKCAT
ncbi:MAG TPA: hypothetical protein VFV00_10020 [Acidimicrobiales bacterium]|nr:hypothetical protein [Acidimicrobiales bacterium]